MDVQLGNATCVDLAPFVQLPKAAKFGAKLRRAGTPSLVQMFLLFFSDLNIFFFGTAEIRDC